MFRQLRHMYINMAIKRILCCIVSLALALLALEQWTSLTRCNPKQWPSFSQKCNVIWHQVHDTVEHRIACASSQSCILPFRLVALVPLVFAVRFVQQTIQITFSVSELLTLDVETSCWCCYRAALGPPASCRRVTWTRSLVVNLSIADHTRRMTASRLNWRPDEGVHQIEFDTPCRIVIGWCCIPTSAAAVCLQSKQTPRRISVSRYTSQLGWSSLQPVTLKALMS